MPAEANRRQHERYEASGEVLVVLQAGLMHLRLKNISLGGALLGKADSDLLEIGTKVFTSLDLGLDPKGEHRSVSLDATIVRKQGSDEIAVNWTPTPLSARRKLEDFITSLSGQPPRKKSPTTMPVE